MCGIAGFFTNQDTAEPQLLEPMLDRLVHRGPDDRGIWNDGRLALGHVRLSILDLTDRGHQPFVTSDGRGVIAYNGEVYNFKELRRDLESEGIHFRSKTDTEVVLYALHHWGPKNAISRFNGMFAFAYYDKRDVTLWMGRDRLGIKPLYFTSTSNTLVFGSEIKSVLAYPGIPCQPDIHALLTQLVYERLEGQWTPFENIKSVNAGTLLKIRDDVEDYRYSDILRDIDPQRILDDKRDFLTHLELLDEKLVSSVHQHLVSDAPLAAMCSGGLDSGLVTAAARMRKSDLVAYVADIQGVKESEAVRARTVCNHLDVELRTVRLDLDDYFRLWPQAVYVNDQPNYFSQSIAAMAVAEAIHQDGFKVVLNGDGADELFGGYSNHARAYKIWRRRRLRAKWIPNFHFLRKLGPLGHFLAPPDIQNLARYPLSDTQVNSAEFILGRQVCALDGGKRYLREAALFRRLEALPLHEERAFLASTFEDTYVHLAESLRSHDRMTMWHSVEARVPFLENQLIDFALHLPCRAKYHNGISKRLISALAGKYLPHSVIRLPKIGFHVSPYMWKGMAGFLKGGWVAEMLKWDNADQDEILQLAQKQSYFIFRLLSTEIWARIYFDGVHPEELSAQLLSHRLGN